MFYKRPSWFTKLNRPSRHVEAIFITLSLNCFTREQEVVYWVLQVRDYYSTDTFDSCFYDSLLLTRLTELNFKWRE